MSYLVLARKWRPKSFDTLVGQEHVVRALTHALQQGRLHHAYLFTGTRGIGKTTIARILAKALNCETGVTPKPCGTCGACVEIDSGRFVDLLEVDAATNTRVDEMRQLLENAVYAPTRGRYKVYVIDEVHMLSNAAFNAMLKTLEEPPEHVKFILATTDPQKIPVTVLSRCLQFNLKQMPQGAIAEHLAVVLNAEGIEAEAGALRHLARAAGGSMRDALSLLDQAIAHGAGRVVEEDVRAMLGSVGNDFIYGIVDALVNSDVVRLYDLARTMEERSLSFDTALASFCDLMVRVQVIQMAAGALDTADPDAEKLLTMAASLHPEYVQLAYEIALRGRAQLGLAPDQGAGFLMTLLRLYAFLPESSEGMTSPSGEKKKLLRPEGSVADSQAESAVAVARTPGDVDVARTTVTPGGASESGPVTGGDAFIAWTDLLGRLNLSGLVREFAQNCALVTYADDEIQLRLDPAHRHLLTRSSQEKLQQAVAGLVRGAPRVVVTLANSIGETPAQAVSRVRREERESAVAAIESDPAVREMIELLDATVSDTSISGNTGRNASQTD
jgi:DNA polymerase-3 subunit gamma/tau